MISNVILLQKMIGQGQMREKRDKRDKKEINQEIKEEIVQNVKTGKDYILTFVRWLVIAIIAGSVCGVLGSLFYKSIEYVTDIRTSYTYIPLFLPLGGIAIVFIYKLFNVYKDKGTNLVLESIHSHDQIPGTMTPLIYIGTVLTHLFGGSSGREGAALQMGGCLGVFIGKKLKMSEKDINILTMCGMSAVFTAMFGTPITATIFSMEVISVGMFQYSAFVPCIIASTISLGIAGSFGIKGETFTVLKQPAMDIFLCGKILLLAIACGLIAILLCQSLTYSHKIFDRLFKNPYLKIAVGGLLVSLFIFITKTQYYSGAGFNIIRDAFNGNVNSYAFIIKLLLTAITLGCGFKGGEIVPALCIGASFGSVFAPILGLNADFGSALGLTCLFCGVVNCPIAAILLAMEMFGQHHLLAFAIASGVSYVFSGCFGLYKSQKILYSKIHAEYINTHTH